MKSLRISKRVIKTPSYLEQFHLEGNKETKQTSKEHKITEKKEPTSYDRKKRAISVAQESEMKTKDRDKDIQRKRKSSENSASAESIQNPHEYYVKISKRIMKMCRKSIDSSHFTLSESEINNLTKDLHFIDESSITYEDIK